MGVLRAAALIATSVFALSGTAQTLFVAPMNLYRTVPAGTVVEEKIRLTSDGDALHATVSVEPFVIGADGTPQQQRVARDLGRWLSVDRAEGDIEQTQPLELLVRIAIPSSASGTFWTAVKIDTQSRVAGRGDVVVVRRRIAIPVVITVPGTDQPLCHLIDVGAVEVNGKLMITATIENAGNVAVRAPVAFAIVRVDASNAEVELASTETEPFLLLPGGKRTLRAELKPHSGESGAEAWAYYRYGPAAGAVTSLRGLIRRPHA